MASGGRRHVGLRVALMLPHSRDPTQLTTRPGGCPPSGRRVGRVRQLVRLLAARKANQHNRGRADPRTLVHPSGHDRVPAFRLRSRLAGAARCRRTDRLVTGYRTTGSASTEQPTSPPSTTCLSPLQISGVPRQKGSRDGRHHCYGRVRSSWARVRSGRRSRTLSTISSRMASVQRAWKSPVVPRRTSRSRVEAGWSTLAS